MAMIYWRFLDMTLGLRANMNPDSISCGYEIVLFNTVSARILVDICPKNYQNARMFAICPKKISRIPALLSFACMFYSVSVY